MRAKGLQGWTRHAGRGRIGLAALVLAGAGYAGWFQGQAPSGGSVAAYQDTTEACATRRGEAPVAAERPSRWRDHSAVRVHPTDAAQRERVLTWSSDLWSEYPTESPLDVVVDASGRAALAEAGIAYEVLVEDIGRVAEQERVRLASPQVARPAPGDWFSEYRPAEVVDAYLDTLAEADPDATRVERIGSSVHGRPIRAIRISTASDDAPAFVINGGQHAREWISVMTSTCLADRMVRGRAEDPRLASLLDRMQVWVVPLVNPDGYAYSWERDRYWRKNRRGDHGVDLNRNFPTAWGGRGASDQPASPIYHGTHPLSEPEAQALAELIERVPTRLHLDYHSFSQLLLHPWSHTGQPAKDKARMSALGDWMASAIHATHGKRYEVVSGAGLYPAAGTLMDWVYDEHDAVSFVVELRPRRGDGFVLPPEQIVPTCDEALAATLELAERTSYGQ